MTVTIDVEVYFLINKTLINNSKLPRNLIAYIVFKKHTCLFSDSHEWSLITVNILP